MSEAPSLALPPEDRRQSPFAEEAPPHWRSLGWAFFDGATRFLQTRSIAAHIPAQNSKRGKAFFIEALPSSIVFCSQLIASSPCE